MLGDNLIYL